MIFKKVIRYLKRQQNNSIELIWANVWHDTICGLEWARDLGSISPGRMAVGYNYLYIMTRILNDKKPKKVLDLGLGISSTLISKYFDYCGGLESKHTIVEHDKAWGDFYLSNHKLSDCSTITYQELSVKMMHNKEYYAYKNLKESIGDMKYSVISVDAPKGGYKCEFSRRDILELLPEVLEQSFVILIDDAERKGEKRTIKDIKAKLSNNDIDFCEGEYKGATYVHIIASKDNKFLCSL